MDIHATVFLENGRSRVIPGRYALFSSGFSVFCGVDIEREFHTSGQTFQGEMTDLHKSGAIVFCTSWYLVEHLKANVRYKHLDLFLFRFCAKSWHFARGGVASTATKDQGNNSLCFPHSSQFIAGRPILSDESQAVPMCSVVCAFLVGSHTTTISCVTPSWWSASGRLTTAVDQ